MLFILLVECAREDGDAVVFLLGCPHTSRESCARPNLGVGSGHTFRPVGLVISPLLGLLLTLGVTI